MIGNKFLRWAFWVLAYGMGPVLIMGLFSGSSAPGNVGVMIFLGILALVWYKISIYGVRMAREMG